MQTMQLRTWLWEAGVSWYKDNVMRMSSSLSYYTLLSLAPILVLVVSIAGLVLGEDAARKRVAEELTRRVGPETGIAIESIILQAREPAESIAGTAAGAFLLLLGASGVFTELRATMNTLWEVKPKPGHRIKEMLRSRLSSYAMVLVVALLLLALLFVGVALAVLGERVDALLPGGAALWKLVDFALSLVAVLVLFAMSFTLIPDIQISFREVWPGAILTTLLFAVGELALGAYIQAFAIGSPYGAAGSAVVLVVWVHYFFQILFFGAEFIKVRAAARKVHVRPRAHAVRTRNLCLVLGDEPSDLE